MGFRRKHALRFGLMLLEGATALIGELLVRPLESNDYTRKLSPIV